VLGGGLCLIYPVDPWSPDILEGRGQPSPPPVGGQWSTGGRDPTIPLVWPSALAQKSQPKEIGISPQALLNPADTKYGSPEGDTC